MTQNLTWTWTLKSAAVKGCDRYGYERAPELDEVLAEGPFDEMAGALMGWAHGYMVYTDSQGIEITIDECNLTQDEDGRWRLTGVFGWAPWIDKGEWIYTPDGDAFFDPIETYEDARELLMAGGVTAEEMAKAADLLAEAMRKLPGQE